VAGTPIDPTIALDPLKGFFTRCGDTPHRVAYHAQPSRRSSHTGAAAFVLVPGILFRFAREESRLDTAGCSLC
jgi:hypothetical protein